MLQPFWAPVPPGPYRRTSGVRRPPSRPTDEPRRSIRMAPPAATPVPSIAPTPDARRTSEHPERPVRAPMAPGPRNAPTGCVLRCDVLRAARRPHASRVLTVASFVRPQLSVLLMSRARLPRVRMSLADLKCVPRPVVGWSVLLQRFPRPSRSVLLARLSTCKEDRTRLAPRRQDDMSSTHTSVRPPHTTCPRRTRARTRARTRSTTHPPISPSTPIRTPSRDRHRARGSMNGRAGRARARGLEGSSSRARAPRDPGRRFGARVCDLPRADSYGADPAAGPAAGPATGQVPPIR